MATSFRSDPLLQRGKATGVLQKIKGVTYEISRIESSL